MKHRLMIGLWRYIINIPPSLLEQQMPKAKKKFDIEHSFMTAEHRLVHHFVVKEPPFWGKPMGPEYIAKKLDLSLEKVGSILEDLERHMTFLFRNSKGKIFWAYPVTVDKTPHRVTFNAGERLYAV